MKNVILILFLAGALAACKNTGNEAESLEAAPDQIDRLIAEWDTTTVQVGNVFKALRLAQLDYNQKVVPLFENAGAKAADRAKLTQLKSDLESLHSGYADLEKEIKDFIPIWQKQSEEVKNLAGITDRANLSEANQEKINSFRPAIENALTVASQWKTKLEEIQSQIAAKAGEYRAMLGHSES